MNSFAGAPDHAPLQEEQRFLELQPASPLSIGEIHRQVRTRFRARLSTAGRSLQRANHNPTRSLTDSVPTKRPLG
jgi:hypothetical protein